MALDKLGNKSLQKRGSQSAEQVYDESGNDLLHEILTELRLMRLYLGYMSDLDINKDDIEEI